MTRVLNFEGPKGAKRFEFCRLAVLSGGNGKGERTREAVRSEARLLEALDSVSDAMPSEADAERRLLTTDGGRSLTVTISQADHDVLSRYLDQTPWLPRVSREAVDVQDWVSAAEKIE